MPATSPPTTRQPPSAVVVGAYEHPGRHLPGYTVPQLHHEVAAGALADAGLDWSDVDGYLCDSAVPGLGPMSMVEYLGLHCSYLDSTDVGGSTYVADLGHAAAAIASGACRVALVTMGGLPRSAPSSNQAGAAMAGAPEDAFERVGTHGAAVDYALAARRHMHEFGTTAEQLAWVKVAASRHAAHNPHAMLPTPVTVEDVLASPMVSDPLHRLDCCVVTDGGGALVVVHPDVARQLGRPGASLRGHGEASRDADGGRVDLTASAAAWSGAQAFAAAGVTPADIRYASIYDSFTITVLLTLEDLGFCARGEGGHFVADAGLSSPDGRLPVNTDGGGLCSNHPANRGGMTKVIEAVRQLRGEAAPALQVPDLELALVSGTGGRLSSRHVSATAVLEAWR